VGAGNRTSRTSAASCWATATSAKCGGVWKA
jgi:hypothetical protein